MNGIMSEPQIKSRFLNQLEMRLLCYLADSEKGLHLPSNMVLNRLSAKIPRDHPPIINITMKLGNYIPLLALLGGFTSVSAESQRLPYSEKVPMNLANKAIPGTSIASSAGIGTPENLLSASATDVTSLQSGKSEAVVKLVGEHLVNNLQFINDGAEGKVIASSSLDEKTWTPLGQVPFTASTRSVPIRFASVGARYIKVSFELTKGSTIRSFEIYGATTNKDYNFSVGGKSEAAGAGTPRPIYAFPTPVNTNEEDFKKNNFKFPKTKDRYRTIIYDLGDVRTIKEFSTAYSSRPTRLEVFAFEQLPEKKDWRGKLTFDPANLDKMQPVASGEDSRGVGHLLVKPEKPVKAQYVAMRFEPNYNRTGAHASVEEESAISGFVANVLEPYTSIVKEFGLGGQFIVAGDTQQIGDADVTEEEFGVFSIDIPLNVLFSFLPNFNVSSGPYNGTGGGAGEGTGTGPTTLDQEQSNAAINALNSYFSNPSFSGGGGGGGAGNPFQIAPGSTVTVKANPPTNGGPPTVTVVVSPPVTPASP